MTMLESMTLSLLSLVLMTWEAINRKSLIESDLDQKRKMLEDDDDLKDLKPLGKIIPGELPTRGLK